MLNDGINRISARAPLVLIAAEDDGFASLIDYIFKNMGLETMTAADGAALDLAIQERLPDVLLLDWRLPGVSPAALCGRLRLSRRTRAIAIVALTPNDDPAIRREVLDSGVDECLERPLSPDRLVTCIRGMLRDSNRMPDGLQELLTFLDLELDLATYRVRRGGRLIHLAPTEFRLLLHLMKNPHRVYSRDELKHAAWPRIVNLGPRTVDVHIGRLRTALNQRGGRPLIRTVRSVGYALSD